jgi:hypothetical protein
VNAQTKRLPAYGRDLLQKRRQGLVPASRHVWIVDRFDFPRNTNGWLCVVADGIDPISIDFSFVAGLEVTIVARTLERLDAIAQGVVAARPKRMVGACEQPPKIRVFVSSN